MAGKPEMEEAMNDLSKKIDKIFEIYKAHQLYHIVDKQASETLYGEDLKQFRLLEEAKQAKLLQTVQEDAVVIKSKFAEVKEMLIKDARKRHVELNFQDNPFQVYDEKPVLKNKKIPETTDNFLEAGVASEEELLLTPSPLESPDFENNKAEIDQKEENTRPDTHAQ